MTKQSIGETNLSTLLQDMKPIRNEGEYVFVTVDYKHHFDLSDAIATIQEKEGLTVILAKETADEYQLSYDFVSTWISLTVHSSLSAVGLTAAFAQALANANISCNVVAGFYHDHIFVSTKDADQAMSILNELSRAS